MKLTAKQTTTRTLADLYRSADRQHAVSITYVDETGAETIRTIEIFDIRTTKNGHIRIHAMCRLRGDARSFDLSRVRSYTVHRTGYVLERPEATTPAGRGIVARSAAQLIARELGRDYLPTRSLTRNQTRLAA